MKKCIIKSMITIALVAILFSCLSFSCFAAETSHIHQPQMSASHPVYVYVVYNIDGKPDYTKSDDYDEEQQVYTATTPDGLTVRVWYPKGGLTLVVHEIKEEEPMKWFNSLFKECSSIKPLEIFFLTERGGRLNLPDGVRIELSGILPQEMMTLLTTKEEKTRLNIRQVDGKLTFYSDADTDYYVLGILKPTLRPETGDDSLIALWIALAALSIMGIMIIAAFLLRPSPNDDDEDDDEAANAHRTVPCAEEEGEAAHRTVPCAEKGGARRRAHKSTGAIPEEMNCYLNEVEERPPERGK